MIPTNGWTEVNGQLAREFQFSGFDAAMDFVNSVADIASEVNHHPDIDIRFDRVIIRLSTHDEDNSITNKDKDLARAIDKLI